MAFLIFIGILSVIAVLGYAITPDSTPYANEQILEIRLQKPMAKVKMVSVKKKSRCTALSFYPQNAFRTTQRLHSRSNKQLYY